MSDQIISDHHLLFLFLLYYNVGENVGQSRTTQPSTSQPLQTQGSCIINAVDDAYQKGSSKLEFRNHWDNTLLNYRPANPPTNRRVRNSRSRLFGFLAGEGRGEGGAGGNGDGVEQGKGKENNMSKLPINRPKAAFRILF